MTTGTFPRLSGNTRSLGAAQRKALEVDLNAVADVPLERALVVSRRSSTGIGILEAHRQRPKWQTWARALKWVAPVTLVAAGLAAYHPWRLSHSVAAVNEHVADVGRLVDVTRPSSNASSVVVLPATLRPWQATELVARVSGYLKVWHKDLGESVSAGDLLAEIDTPELDQELAAAIALALEADASATQARAERVEAEADLKVAESQLDRIKAELELLKSQTARRTKLLANQIVSQEEFDTYQRQFEAKAADLAATESEISRRRSNLNTRTAIIAVRDATAKSRNSTVDRLQELQIFKKIVAPFDGVVTRRNAEVGMLVTSGKEVLFAMQDMSRLRVTLNVPQSYSAETKVGVETTITLPETPGRAILATVTRVADSVDTSSRTMLTEIELENSTHQLQPGSYAQVALKTDHAGQLWTIPTNTVSMRVDGPHVAVVNQDNEVELRKVTLGRDLGMRVIVAKGIQGDEQLVVNPRDDLTDGQRVRVGNDQSAKLVAHN